jgi:hypothetical protein
MLFYAGQLPPPCWASLSWRTETRRWACGRWRMGVSFDNWVGAGVATLSWPCHVMIPGIVLICLTFALPLSWPAAGIRRSPRWCQGNLRLLASPAFHNKNHSLWIIERPLIIAAEMSLLSSSGVSCRTSSCACDRGNFAYLGYQACVDEVDASERDFNSQSLSRACSCALSLRIDQRCSYRLWWERHTSCLSWFRFRARGCGSCTCILRFVSLWFGRLFSLGGLITVWRRTTTKFFMLAVQPITRSPRLTGSGGKMMMYLGTVTKSCIKYLPVIGRRFGNDKHQKEEKSCCALPSRHSSLPTSPGSWKPTLFILPGNANKWPASGRLDQTR